MYKITPELDKALEELENTLSKLMSRYDSSELTSEYDPEDYHWDYYCCAFCGDSERSDRYAKTGIKHYPDCLGRRLMKALWDAREE